MSKKKHVNFSTQMGKLGIAGNYAEIESYLRGKTVIITSSTNGHNYGPIGSKVTFQDNLYVNSASTSGSVTRGIPGGNNIKFSQFSVIEEPLTEKGIKEKIKDLKESKKEIDEQIKEEEAKIAYLKETGSKEYDENEFKAYHTLKLVDDPTLSTIEKAKIIAKLVNS